MSDETPDRDPMLGFLAEAGRDRLDPVEHPSPETLTAYQANELSPAEDERIQSHLAVCAHCTEMLLELDEFLKPPVAAEPVADFEAAADWRKLQAGLRRPEKNLSQVRPDRRRFFASVWGGYSLAAALLVATVGLGLRNVELARELKKPQPIIATRSLSAQGSSRGVERLESVSLPAQIILILPTNGSASLYKVEIFRQDRNELLWTFDVPLQNEELSFNLPAQSLLPGTYTLHVSTQRTGQLVSQAWKYRLSVGPPGN